jgi:hypothetical protein
MLSVGMLSAVASIIRVGVPCHKSNQDILSLTSIGLLVFGFVANEYKHRAIRLYLTICNIWSPI